MLLYCGLLFRPYCNSQVVIGFKSPAEYTARISNGGSSRRWSLSNGAQRRDIHPRPRGESSRPSKTSLTKSKKKASGRARDANECEGEMALPGEREGIRPETARTHVRTSPGFGPSEHPLAHLPRSIGNQAVQRLMTERDELDVRPKLEVGRPADKYDCEADRVAEQVLRTPESAIAEEPTEGGFDPRIQRMYLRCRDRFRREKPLDCADCEEKLRRRELTRSCRTSRWV